MFEHAHGNNFIKRASDIPVITFQDADRQMFAEIRGVPGLLSGNVDGGDGAAICFSRISRKAAPPAADVQNVVLPPDSCFAADQVELFLLGAVQVGGAVEVSAAVLIVGVEKGKEQVVVEIVVALCNDVRARFRLEVLKPHPAAISRRGI
jgi:hypothetical protein